MEYWDSKERKIIMIKRNKKKLDENNIMMVSSVHVWKDARIYYKEAISLQKHYSVDFYAIDDGTYKHDGSKKNLKVNLLRKQSRIKRPLIWKNLYKYIIKSDAKYYHIQDPELLLLVPFIRWRKKRAVLIFDMHENFPDAIKSKEWIPKNLRLFLSYIVKYIERYLLKKVDAVIFAEKTYAKNYSYLTNVQTCEVLNYPNFKNIETIRRKKNKELITLIYVGRIASKRGIWEMLELMRELKNRYSSQEVNLKLIGYCSNSLEQEINEYIQEHNLSSYVSYIGSVSYEQLSKQYSKADIGICILSPIPNYLNSMATKIFEYMAMQLPVIISDFPEWKKMLYKEKSGLCVDPLDIKDIVNKVETLIQNPQMREELGFNGRRAFENNYSWQSEEKKLLGLYQIFKENI